MYYYFNTLIFIKKYLYPGIYKNVVNIEELNNG